jgi:hypothetical protein
MNKIFSFLLFACLALQLFWPSQGICANFDERLWEKYAEIEFSAGTAGKDLAGLYLNPKQIGDISTKTPFADFRVITDQKEEVPWHIVIKRPENRQTELPHRMQNLSLTPQGDTWLEIVFDKQPRGVDTLEIITTETDFSRQVEIFGSADGRKWHTVRNDAVIFDLTRQETFRHTKMTFPPTGFHYLAVKIINGNARALEIKGVRVFQQSVISGQIYVIQATLEKPQIDTQKQESSIATSMDTAFPIDQLVIETSENNFQRFVEVQIRHDKGDWQRWASGTIFDFSATNMRESRLTIDIPEIAAKEFRLVFKDFDSPPLPVTAITGKGYRRLLLFKQQPGKKLFLFWRNSQAATPVYDLASVVSRQNIDDLAIVSLGQPRANTKFAGSKARLPFSERYKHLLYLFVILGIGGLIFLQYRVLRAPKK